MQKTPISILHEMMVKEHSVPDYVLVLDGGGTHVNTFVYEVSCNGLSARGTGRSKKDAKHQAAKNMLETIAAHRGYPQLPASPAQSPAKIPVPVAVPASSRIGMNVPFVNAIGELQALCTENNLGEPEYIAISDEGPPHARIFTYHCVLSTFKEEGVATTKKQAKHEAAKKMWNRLKNLVDDKSLFDNKRRRAYVNTVLTDEIAKERYFELRKFPMKKINLGLKITDYHIKIKQFFEAEETKECLEFIKSILSSDKVEHNKETIDSDLNNFEDILKKLDINFIQTKLETNSPDINCVCLSLNYPLAITQCGLGTTEYEAKYQAFIKLVNFIMVIVN